MSNITRFPNGITDYAESHPFHELPIPDHEKTHEYFDDFNFYQGNDGHWDLLQNGGSALIDSSSGMAGGFLALIIGAANNDYTQLTGNDDNFSLFNKTWFGTRIANTGGGVFDADQEYLFGMSQANIEIVGPTPDRSGIYFRISNGQLSVEAYEGGNLLSSVDVLFTLPTAADEYFTLEYVWDPSVNQISYGVNGVSLGILQTTNVARVQAVTLQAGATNLAASGFSLNLDYMYGAHDRFGPMFPP